MKVLVGSPIKQKTNVLEKFLTSLKELEKDDLEIKYIFIDDNDKKESSDSLLRFRRSEENVDIYKLNNVESNYICDSFTHRWSKDIVNKVIDFKNFIIEIAKKEDFDYLFFIDSDLILHPKTLKRLLSLNKEIVSTVFWTKWYPSSMEEPQVWLKDNYTLYDSDYGEEISKDEEEKRKLSFIEMLKKPGIYKVGGLGACTLIDKSSLNKGVNFSRLYNISYIGEDRHFCIRAAALGIQLYVDTYYPAYHIYREEDLEGVEEYKKGNINLDFKINRLNAYNTLKVALEGIGDCGYNKPINRKYLNFFEEDLVSSILLNYNGTIIKDRVKNKREIISYKIIEMNNIDEVKIKVIYSDRGYSNDYSYYKEFFSEFIVKILKNEYKIVSWDNKVEREPIVTPLIRKAKDKGNKLTLSMVVKNEENRFLKEVLISAKEYIDNAVIIDDGSTDNTVDIIEDILKDIPYRLIKNEESKFSNEVSLRRQQWDETIKINPDWIVFLDADEIFEDKFKDYIRVLMENTEVDGYLFRLYDFWDENHYRDDSLWCAHNTYRLFLIRYQENYNYLFKETAQHCGRIPYNCINLPYFITTLRLKHYGWARVQDRIEKYNRYMKLDPKGEFGSLEQYKSILDKNPSLTLWEENNM